MDVVDVALEIVGRVVSTFISLLLLIFCPPGIVGLTVGLLAPSVIVPVTEETDRSFVFCPLPAAPKV